MKTIIEKNLEDVSWSKLDEWHWMSHYWWTFLEIPEAINQEVGIEKSLKNSHVINFILNYCSQYFKMLHLDNKNIYAT